ncbi:suppressor APC domain-containing protein 2 isoform X4 [Macaca fascicularis]|uniref:suppressor APC domain-containing protein 2 isoform X4 n=1 Tax=Macaca fascicularis TaxID=9541 RepID=UPI003D1598A9
MPGGPPVPEGNVGGTLSPAAWTAAWQAHACMDVCVLTGARHSMYMHVLQLKQMKELEQEKEVLLQGLEMMARGRDWYQQQLQRVQERQRRLGQSRASADCGAAGSPRPLGRLLPKVQEVARCLGELLAAACASRVLPPSSSGPPCPALTSTSPLGWQQQTILMLKEQNRLLTQEVTEKSERITQLEQEKSALIKQLFEARALSQQDGGPLDSTFI